MILIKKDPGFLMNKDKSNKSKEQKLLDLLKIHESDDICPDCIIKKPSRSKHCDICGKCVMVYDHHC